MPWVVVGFLLRHRRLVGAIVSGVSLGSSPSSPAAAEALLSAAPAARDSEPAGAPTPRPRSLRAHEGPQRTFTAWAIRQASYQGQTRTVNPTQNAEAIIAAAAAQNLPGRAAVIALATAIQESTLNEYAINGNTIGLFQQDTSYQNRTDPTNSAAAFLERLVKVPNWQTLPLTVAAQDVQKSAFPQAYAQWESPAADAVVNLTGGEAPVSNTANAEMTADCPGAGLDLTSAQVPAQAFPIITPVPAIQARSLHQVLEQIPVPSWPAGIQSSGRIEPDQVGNQCVQAALWTYAVLHLSDPGYAHPPTFAGVGQAADMYAAAQKNGWSTSATPVTGSMVVFNRQVDSAGHIATVLATGSTDFEVIEQNWLNFEPDADRGVGDLRSGVDPLARSPGHRVHGRPARCWAMSTERDRLAELLGVALVCALAAVLLLGLGLAVPAEAGARLTHGRWLPLELVGAVARGLGLAHRHACWGPRRLACHRPPVASDGLPLRLASFGRGRGHPRALDHRHHRRRAPLERDPSALDQQSRAASTDWELDAVQSPAGCLSHGAKQRLRDPLVERTLPWLAPRLAPAPSLAGGQGGGPLRHHRPAPRGEDVRPPGTAAAHLGWSGDRGLD